MSNGNEQLKKIFVENWTSVFNTLLGRDVVLTVNSVQVKSKKEAAHLVRGLQSFVSVTYGESPGEALVIGSRKKLVSIVANMMIGLDSFKDDITAADKDAFTEAVSQMFSACQAPLKDTFDMDMRFRDMVFIESGDPLQPISSNSVQLWIITFELPGTAVEKFVMMTPENFAAAASEEEDRIGKIMMEPLAQGGAGGSAGNVGAVNAVNTRPNVPPGKFPPASSSIDRTRVGIGLGVGVGSSAGSAGSAHSSNIDLLMDVELPITIRIGATEMKLIDIMRLGLGSIIELEKMVDDPVEILANDKLVAKGEVVICDGNYAVKITEVRSKEERIRSLT
jgi:flagellar motor switch protein FliN/FliY